MSDAGVDTENKADAPPEQANAGEKEGADVPYGGPMASSRINPNAVMGSDEHMLRSTARGESSIELLARKIEDRRANRIPVTFRIRKFFLHKCMEIAKSEGLKNKISKEAMYKLRDEYKEKCQNTQEAVTVLGKTFGVWDQDATMLTLLNVACEKVEEVNSDWLHYRDFVFYRTLVTRKFQLFTNPLMGATFSLLIFYIFSAILFCPIMQDEAVCPNRGTSDGWLTSIYFASVTMSTVGYGDVNLSGGERWRTFIGIVYMLLAMGMAYTVFSSAADVALGASQIGSASESIFGSFLPKQDDQTPLYKQIRRVVFLRVSELVFWFIVLNMAGVFVVRLFIRNSDVESQQWDWMTTLYWAVQTTTTIGYGDLDMPFNMRWFQVFYTTLGTAFMGAVFGEAAALRSEIMDLARFYAWKRRETSKRMIQDMQAPGSDDKVDQYEFLVASLLLLNKVEHSDLEQIMDKFRELAGDKGYIVYEPKEATEAQEEEEDDSDRCEADEVMMIE